MKIHRQPSMALRFYCSTAFVIPRRLRRAGVISSSQEVYI